MIEIRQATADDEPRLHAIHHQATMSSYGRELRWLDSILADRATPLEVVEWTIVAVDAKEHAGGCSTSKGDRHTAVRWFGLVGALCRRRRRPGPI